MEYQTSLQKILWTVDPFAKDKGLQRSAAWGIKSLTQDNSCVIHPVYLFDLPAFEGQIALHRLWLHEIRETGQEELNKILSSVELKGIKPLHVVSLPGFSLREGISRISRIAKRWNANLVVTSTHARKGLKRFVLGSFAETLLLYSEVPLFLVNPHWNRSDKFKHILFPTDFSQESKEVFHQVIELAKLLGSEITLFHKLIYTFPPTIPLSIHSYPLYKEAFERELKSRREDMSMLAEEAKVNGVPVIAIIDHEQPDSVADVILQEAKKKPGLIAMVSRSGPSRKVFLGSTTRKTVRTSPYPVWVLHPKQKAEEKNDKIRSINSVRKDEQVSITGEDNVGDLKRIPHVKKIV